MAASTRIIAVSGDLHFGNVFVGQDAVRQITVTNRGTSTLTVTGMDMAGGTGPRDTQINWTGGPIAAGATQTFGFKFAPMSVGGYSGTFEVQSDATSGTGTLPFSGNGVELPPPFEVAGGGDNIFELPSSVQRVHVHATYTGNSQNFIVHLNGHLWINELLGTGWDATVYDGVLAAPGGGTVEITGSSGVQWVFTEVR
jgi:hypothetical protein